MAIASASPPSASPSAFTASRVVRPQSSRAGFTSAPDSVTDRYDGAAARPLMNTASKPVRLCRGEAPAEGRIEEEAGQRRLAGDAGAAVAGHGRVGDRPHTEDDRVIRRERVRAGRNPVVEQARREAVAAQEPSGRALAERLDTRRARREVDVQDAAAVTLQRPMSFSPLRAASTRSAGAPVCAISLRYTTSAASICLSAVKLVPAASRARRPVGDSGATYAAVM